MMLNEWSSRSSWRRCRSAGMAVGGGAGVASVGGIGSGGSSGGFGLASVGSIGKSTDVDIESRAGQFVETYQE